MEHRVKVWGQDVSVTTERRSKTVWIAVGNYMDQRIETKGSSANSALRLWVDAARYRGN